MSSPEDTRESTRFHSEPPAFFRYLEENLAYFSSTTPTSWTLSPGPLLQSVTVLMVISLVLGHGRAEDIFKAATDSTTSERITCLRLEGLKASDVVRKACQELGVRSIPRELAR